MALMTSTVRSRSVQMAQTFAAGAATSRSSFITVISDLLLSGTLGAPDPRPASVDVERQGQPSARYTRGAMQQPMYHPDDLASMDPLVLMKNLDHVRMTSRRLSYILQGQVHLYRPEANELRMRIDLYVEAERAIEAELARRQIRA
jgi:hypothetical protein